MKIGIRCAALLVFLALLVACATTDSAPQESEESAETVAGATLATTIQFVTGDGTVVGDGETITLATGGGPGGRLIPQSEDESVPLYITRDGSVPSAENNWSGPIDPANPSVISAALERAALYTLIAISGESVSAPVSVQVAWQHETNPNVGAPTFLVNGRSVSGSITIPVSDSTDPAARLQVECDYLAATLFITRDGTEPSADNNWQTQTCDGTFIWSPEPTAAEYRAVAVWQGVTSPVASVRVTWEASD